VKVLPLSLVTLVDSITGIMRYQLVQTASNTLRVRLVCNSGTGNEHIRTRVKNKHTDFLESIGLGDVTVVLGSEAPEQGEGGKFRTIIPHKD
jgi:phenylacetate-CoA ligase